MDLYQEITSRIIAQMEQGTIPWKKPWVGSSSAVSYTTGKPYSLLNQMLLGEPGEYLTFRQCQQAGGFVRKGEKSRMVVFWKWIEQEDEESSRSERPKEANSGEDIYPQPRSCNAKAGQPKGETQRIPFLRYYNVFHIRQCENIQPRRPVLPVEHAAADRTADAIIRDYTTREVVHLHHNTGDRAFYRPSDDSVTVPGIAQFPNTAEYYSTIFHELTHSTGHAKRLNRIEKTAFFGSEAYSKEELVAEIGAAALVNHAGLETASSFRNNAAYIQNWLQVLRNDKRFIVSAAGRAEKAVRLILGQADGKQNA